MQHENFPVLKFFVDSDVLVKASGGTLNDYFGADYLFNHRLFMRILAQTPTGYNELQDKSALRSDFC